jgi:GrpB-like predicted nucleotidyltransferase (UPF0157 family)
MKFFEPSQYQSECEKLFTLYQAKIAAALPTAKVEHIGASSILGAISKGDLDIYVEVSPTEMDKAIKILFSIGFVEKSNTLRTPALCMLETQSADDVAVQLVAQGSEFEFFLHFRDALNTNAALVRQYNLLKKGFEGQSEDSYRTAKTQFIERALREFRGS